MTNNNAQVNSFTEIELTDEQLESIYGGVLVHHDLHPHEQNEHNEYNEHHNEPQQQHPRGWYDERHHWHPGQRHGYWDRWHRWHWYNW